jgi:hypothetical protein
VQRVSLLARDMDAFGFLFVSRCGSYARGGPVLSGLEQILPES